MDLTASEGVASAQLHELIPHGRAILEDSEAPPECRCIRRRFRDGESLSPGLLSCHYGDVFAQGLSADRERLVDSQPGKSSPCLITEWCTPGRRIDEDVGVDEAHLPSSSYRSSRRRPNP